MVWLLHNLRKGVASGGKPKSKLTSGSMSPTLTPVVEATAAA
eukprot:CAMPEP_0172799492 /NCGR_PEP_ID=MMETSP1075-20121228/1908_1 /TAXON_ID=2916 /ORGANISM="Ceratium fusus, Strain PA161109" /LENGTH=41 /DNA_ID= /DNA_START= /DNA_END= /DNA_ORIENTATION=